MKIAIDVSQVVYGTGVAIYTKQIIKNLLKIDTSNEYLLFGGVLRQYKNLNNFFDSLDARFGHKVFPIPPSLADLIWNRIHLFPIDTLIGTTDVFHSSDWTQPPSKAFKTTTIHDLFPIRFPKLTPKKVVSTHVLRLKWVEKEVDRVIVPSQSTKRDVIDWGLKEEKIVVIPEAPTYEPASRIEIDRIKRKYLISGKFLLAIGVSIRKNTERIIKAFEKVRPGKDLKLVIVGQPFMKLEPTRGVKILGFVPDEDIPGLLSGSEALIYPSIYEGFGLPILEAFHCGTAVVTSNLGSMAEIGENAALLVDPFSVDSIAEGIMEAVEKRQTFVKIGKEKAKYFSWTFAAKETLKTFKESQ